MIETTTPKIVSHKIRQLLKKMGLSDKPEFVNVISEDWCIESECFENVNNKVKKEGGKRILGWQIWEWENVLIEAEFHSVWEDPITNTLIDITPKTECEILFVKDPKMVYSGIRIDNYRMALRQDRLINDFIQVSRELNDVILHGSHPDNPTESTFTGSDMRKFQTLISIKSKLLGLLVHGGSENSKCFCGSERKYKNCHAIR